MRASACRVASGTLDRNVSTSADVGTVFGAAATRRTIPTIDQGARTDKSAGRLLLLAADVRRNQTGGWWCTRLCDRPLSSSSGFLVVGCGCGQSSSSETASHADTHDHDHRQHAWRLRTSHRARTSTTPPPNDTPDVAEKGADDDGRQGLRHPWWSRNGTTVLRLDPWTFCYGTSSVSGCALTVSRPTPCRTPVLATSWRSRSPSRGGRSAPSFQSVDHPSAPATAVEVERTGPDSFTLRPNGLTGTLRSRNSSSQGTGDVIVSFLGLPRRDRHTADSADERAFRDWRRFSTPSCSGALDR